ncbi:Hypothetical predicted protein [Paramuricea clavata]|uniref:Uncharacterized protein n=1 Tax=Paramuricea clavata TaxID=317549 RepID=A0A6S7HW45_PARCT|nr:Hypothetical predicted protein [Paramuricea clavata]
MTPVQLWVSGLNNLDEATGTLSNSAESSIDAHGIDYEGPLPSQRFNGETWNENSVEVPEIACPVNDTQVHQLRTMVNPLGASSSYGMDIYCRTVQLVENMLEIE